MLSNNGFNQNNNSSKTSNEIVENHPNARLMLSLYRQFNPAVLKAVVLSEWLPTANFFPISPMLVALHAAMAANSSQTEEMSKKGTKKRPHEEDKKEEPKHGYHLRKRKK